MDVFALSIDRSRGCPQREFLFYGDMAFVTYSRSRINDKNEFLHKLQASLQRNLGACRNTRGVSMEIFGSKELHEDGTPHYHVVVRFSKKVYWKKAREMFSVRTWDKGKWLSDTHSIFIRKKPAKEEVGKFLYCVQRYISKEGDVFGQWISSK